MTPLHNRVLVIDDESTIRDLIADALREAGYRVETAPNGAEALRLMRRSVPHALVLDLMMPRLDGFAFVELMRMNPRLASVPIVLVTATYCPAEAAERLGARACITKPFELDELLEVVGRLVGMPLPLASAEQLAELQQPPSMAAEPEQEATLSAPRQGIQASHAEEVR